MLIYSCYDLFIYFTCENHFNYIHPLKGKVAAPILALRRVGGGQTRIQLYGYFLSQGMVPVRGAIGYGREKGDVKEGVGGNIGFTALEEARAAGKDIVEMLQKLS